MCWVRGGVQEKVFIFKIAQGLKVSDKLLLKVDAYYKLRYAGHRTELFKVSRISLSLSVSYLFFFESSSFIVFFFPLQKMLCMISET